jgi:UDP-3-O-[3-hydroxymyristoyl] N-acetylglucosamine deacetylase
VLSGKTLFTNRVVTVTLVPQKERQGIFFQRTDVEEALEIPALLPYVISTERRVTLGKNGVTISLVEHLLSALAGFAIDSLLIKVDGPEIPILDGSSKKFVDHICKCGFEELPFKRGALFIEEPILFSEKGSQLIALPSETPVYSTMVHYPGNPLLNWQTFVFPFIPESYAKEIAPARTFALLQEVEMLEKLQGLQGGSLDVAVVIDGETVLNPEGLRFPEEMARHKVLDLIGDLSLIGSSVVGHFIAIRGGHTSHIGFARKIEEKSCLIRT